MTQPMNRRRIIYAAVMLLWVLAACVTTPILPDSLLTQNVEDEVPCPEGIVSFKYEVLPLVVSSCAFEGCHDAISREEGIVLDSYENIMKEVKPGDPNDSELYEYLLESGDDIMPPRPYEPLSDENIALIKRWIEQGAKNTTCGDGCVPDAASFSENVMPTIQNFCVGCHYDNNLQGEVNLQDYDFVKEYVDNGQLMGTIEHLAGHNPMPPSGNKLSDCRITQIQNWIDAGAQNN